MDNIQNLSQRSESKIVLKGTQRTIGNLNASESQLKGYTVTVEDINRRSITSKNRETIAEKVKEMQIKDSAVKKVTLVRGATGSGSTHHIKAEHHTSEDHESEGQSPRDESRKNFIQHASDEEDFPKELKGTRRSKTFH